MKPHLICLLIGIACHFLVWQPVLANDVIVPPADMSLIPAGAFTMGRSSGDTDGDAPPAVTVTLSSFMIGKHEVSRTLWNDVRAWASANGYTDLATGGSRALSHPVYSISWFDAVKWCNARSEREGLTPCYTVGGAVMRTGTLVPAVNWNANGYRLPTEAEWEKAARGGVAGKRFPWGTDTISHTEANFQNNGGEAYAVGTTGYHPTHGIGTAPCGSFGANDYGLHDMAGNVWEWCWDWWGSNYVNGAFDPRGPASGDYRVFRGGSWFNNAKSARSANRGVNFPTVVSTTFGFRVARSAVPSVIPPEITGHPSAATINSGSTTTLVVAATGSAPLAYQWYQGAAGNTDTPVGANSPLFYTPLLFTDTSYWVRVINSAGSVDSAAAMVTVITPPAITTQPAAATINSGGTTTLTVAASGSAPLAYQWYQGAAGTTDRPVGTDSSSFTTPALSMDTSYWVRVSNSAGSADSEAAMVTVIVPPSIISHPDSMEIWDYESATLYVSASGSQPLSYQWYAGSSGDTSQPVGTGDSFRTNSGGTYWVRVSNAAGNADSGAASVTVRFLPPDPPLIISQPASTTIPSDSSVTLTVAANGTAPLSYQWYQGPVGTMTMPVGSDSNRFTTPALTQTTSYWVRVSNSAGSVDSEPATVAVISSAPLIITQPVSTTALTGDTATLSVNARGSLPLAYQWYQGAAGVTTTPVGINSASFTTPALTTTTSYWVRVSNSYGSVDSAAATIKVQASATEVTIPDPILLAELRKALAKPTGAITDLDLLTLTTLRIAGLGISDLTGLEYATNLRILDIRRNNFTDPAALWVVLDQITPMYCLYTDVRRPGQTPYGIVAQQLTDTSGNSFFILVDAPNLPSLDFNSLSVDTSNPSNISALQTINEAGVAVETGGVNLPPSAQGSATVLDHEARTVQLSAAGSADIDGTITSYAWSWSDGSASGFSPAVTLPYGDTWVTLTVTDDDGAMGSYSLMVTLLRPYSTPAVANLTASQRPGTQLVDIRYDVSAFTPAVTSRLRISSDGGTTFSVPATTLSGAIRGPFSTGTGKSIVWDAGADWPQQFSQTMRFEVTANDGIGTPDDMSLIPAGSFTMGRTSGDTDSNAPPVDVNVSAFYMGKNEVTKALWDEVRTWAVANGYTDLATGAGKAANHPVQSVSWWDAVKWCNARSEMEGLTPCYTVGAAVMKTGTTAPTVNWSANGYRLPTEAEWEKAARGGVSGKRFPWGTDTISHSLANYRNDGGESYAFGTTGYHPTYATESQPHTSPVTAFPVSGYGLHDMTGNVREWCWDWYGDTTYLTGSTDPRGANSGSLRVFRGGGWGSYAYYCRAAYRNYSVPGGTSIGTGFRVARSPLADVVPPTITSQPASTAVVGNIGTTLTVAAAGTSPFSYQWYQGAVGVTTNPVGSNAAAFSAPAPTATTRYWVRVSNAAGSVDSIAATVDAMSLVPSGNFTMGRSSGDSDVNAPPVTVNTYAFQIGKFEVSKALWDEVRGWAFTNGYSDLPEAGGKTPEHPAHGISWFDALKWCNARSEKEGLTPVYIDNRAVMKTGTAIPTVNWSADGYRLPSEAEWEKAARGGRSDRRFPWGDTISHSQANYLSSSLSSYDVSPTRGHHPSYAVSPSPFTSPIGSFAANDYGLHDTSGNVREWCWDWYDAAYYANNASDPRGPATGTNRVIRGGSSETGAEDSRSMHRGSQAPTPANPSDGFRVARGPLVSLTAPAIITQPASSTIASGTTTTLRVTAAGSSPMTYQWYQGAVGTTTTPVGTNSPNFTTPALTATTSYWVRISNADGILNSAAVTVTIPVAPGITMQPASTTINSGETTTLAVTATGTAPLTYQWYQGAVGTTTTPVGENSASFTTPTLTATTTYWVRVSNSAGSVDSTLATVTVSSNESTREVLLIGSGSRVLEFDATNGEYLGDFISGYAPQLVYDLRIGPGGDLYVLDYSPKQIHRFDGKTGAHKGIALQFSGNFAEEFAFSTDGDFYLGQSDRINRYSFQTGALLGSVVPPVTGRTQPAGMLVDGGDLFVSFLSTPGGGAGVWKFDAADGANGQELIAGLPGNGPRQPFKTSDGRLLVPVWQSSRIDRFAAGNYAHQGFWNTIYGAHSLAYSANGTLLALIDASSASSVKMLDPQTGAFLGDFIAQGAGGMGRANSFVRLTRQIVAGAAPAITTEPESVSITSGETTTLAVTATGTAPLTYQWYQGAVGTTTTPVGENSASFTTPTLTATTTYWVRVSNSAGSVDSTLATVSVSSSTADELSHIPAGSFTMGRTSGDTDSNAPSVTVTVSAFYMGKNEVTKALWDEVRTWATANGYTDLATGEGKAANHPVQTVSWWDVIKWCNARSEKEGLTPCYTVSGAVMKTGTTAPTVNWAANGYRLPTEAEWEKAARGGVSGKRFPWGTDTISQSQANYYASTSYSYDASGSVNNYHPSYNDGASPYTSPVGSFAANGYGLNDVAGNVWEWCWDWYGASTYVNGATDPRGAASGSVRVRRGGSWFNVAVFCRAADRRSFNPTGRDNRIGFRIARSSVP